jgi:hypothetical protein
MNLICPHCQKMLTVPDENAGQLTKCSHCEQTFLVPSLPQPVAGGVLEDLPLDIPLAPLPPEAAATTPPSAAKEQPPMPEDDGGVYRVAAEPPWPAPGQSERREERVSASVRPPTAPAPRPPRVAAPPPKPAPAPPPPKAPPPPPPSGFEHIYVITLSPRVVQWIAPICLALVFLLLFFPWVGAYPAGHGVYTQSGFQAWWGTFSTDPVGEKVLKKDAAIREAISMNFFRVSLWLILILGGIALAAAPLVMSRFTIRLPAALEQLWPWRQALLGGITLLALVILLSLAWGGLGLERALEAPVHQQIDAQQTSGMTGEETQMMEIRRGAQLGELNLRRTVWLRWAVFFNLLALAGVGVEFWLERRGARLPPRAELNW